MYGHTVLCNCFTCHAIGYETLPAQNQSTTVANITVQFGAPAVLHCRVTDLTDKTTVHIFTFMFAFITIYTFPNFSVSERLRGRQGSTYPRLQSTRALGVTKNCSSGYMTTLVKQLPWINGLQITRTLYNYFAIAKGKGVEVTEKVSGFKNVDYFF